MTTTNGQSHRMSERELRESLRTRFTEAVAAGKPRTARRLLESWWLFDGFGGSDAWDRLRPSANTDVDAGQWLPPNVPSDRRHGYNWPIWRTQVELDRFRQISRTRVAINSYAQGLLKNLTNNIIGKGFSYKVQMLGLDGQPMKEKPVGPDLVYQQTIQRFVDKFLRVNHWNCATGAGDGMALAATREREAFRTVQIDGEHFLRFFHQEDGMTILRVIDAAQVRDGSGHLIQEGWSYGIQHQMDPYEDIETYQRYAVFWPDPAATGGTIGGKDMGVWEEIDADQILHLKGPDTPSTVKRGLPLFLFDVGDALDRAAKLQKYVSISEAIKAAIVETWQFDQATQAQITSMAQAMAQSITTDTTTGKPDYVERWRPGTIRRGSAGATKVEESASNAPSRLQTVQGDLQHACAGAGVASFVIGDVSSGNYSNYESASFPPVQNASCEQEYYKLAFSRVVWKALEWAAQKGAVPEDVRQRVEVQVEAPAVLHRNELEKAQEDQISIQSGWKDRQTCAAERGLDWDTVQANNDEYQQAQGGLGAELPLPGEEGEPPAVPFGQKRALSESKDASGHEHDQP